MTNDRKDMNDVIALCKSRGFIFPGSEIYGGLANSWDYGPLGVELKNNIKKAWWKKFIQENPHNVGMDSAILMNPEVWKASGHVGGFSDPLMDCRECKTRHRADKLIEDSGKMPSGWSFEQMSSYIKEKGIVCPSCGKSNFTDIRNFNLMFKTFQGVTEDAKSEIYLRPETAQGIFVNFKNVSRASRKKLPFGIGQIGKSFRNEITPGNFIFRTREFEQMELEFFCRPEESGKWFEYWKNFCLNFLLSLNVSKENLRMRDHVKEELSHYSDATTDIEFQFPFGMGELWGIASRRDFDLSQHSENSGEKLEYFDSETGEHFTPYCIEPSLGADRAVLAFLVDALENEEVQEGETRTVLKLHPYLAPFKLAVLPLSKKLSPLAFEAYEKLLKLFMCDFDETGSIGKRYRRQDEIGTPYCVTFDFDTHNDNAVTVRDRDSMHQERISIDKLPSYIAERIDF